MRRANTLIHERYPTQISTNLEKIPHIRHSKEEAFGRTPRSTRRAAAAPAGPGATVGHRQAGPSPAGAASEPPDAPNGSNLAIVMEMVDTESVATRGFLHSTSSILIEKHDTTRQYTHT